MISTTGTYWVTWGSARSTSSASRPNYGFGWAAGRSARNTPPNGVRPCCSSRLPVSTWPACTRCKSHDTRPRAGKLLLHVAMVRIRVGRAGQHNKAPRATRRRQVRVEVGDHAVGASQYLSHVRAHHQRDLLRDRVRDEGFCRGRHLDVAESGQMSHIVVYVASEVIS